MWPFSRKRTYIDGVTQIPAEDMNDIQDFDVLVKTLLGIPTTTPTIVSDAPQLLLKDAAGNVRGLYDHNGYPMGRRSELRIEWNQSSDGRLVGYTANAPTAAYPSAFGSFVGPTSVLDAGGKTAQAMTHFGSNFLSVVLEAEIAYSALTAAHTTVTWGFSDNLGINSSTNAIWFQCALGGNWNGFVTGHTALDLGVPPVSGSVPSQRLRLEVHGTASPYAGKVRFFINGVLRGEIAGAIPSAALLQTMAVSGISPGPTVATTGYVGPVFATWNRQLSQDAL